MRGGFRFKFKIFLVLLLPAAALADCSPDESRVFYVVRHGWHTGLIIERDLLPKLPQPESRWVELGWGQRRYYMEDETTFLDTVRAALPSASVLHVAAFNEHPAEYFCDGEVIELRASQEALSRVSRFVSETFTFDGEGKTVALGPGLYGESKFYAAEPTFYGLRNCNTWIGRALEKAGCRVGRVVHAENLMKYAERSGKKVRCRKN